MGALDGSVLLFVMGGISGGLGGCSVPAEEPPPTISDQVAPDRVFLLIGQSNMAGRAAIERDDRAVDLHIWSASSDGGWGVASAPIHRDNPIAQGLGPGLPFAQSMRHFYDAREILGLVPAAVGGTSIQEWSPPGQLLAAALAQTSLAVGNGSVEGVLWHQGEEDAGLLTARAYASHLKVVIGSLRDALGPVPIVLGELGDFVEEGAAINTATHAVARRFPRVGVASARGLTSEDGIHFDAESIRAFGERYASVFRQLKE